MYCVTINSVGTCHSHYGEVWCLTHEQAQDVLREVKVGSTSQFAIPSECNYEWHSEPFVYHTKTTAAIEYAEYCDSKPRCDFDDHMGYEDSYEVDTSRVEHTVEATREFYNSVRLNCDGNYVRYRCDSPVQLGPKAAPGFVPIEPPGGFDLADLMAI